MKPRNGLLLIILAITTNFIHAQETGWRKIENTAFASKEKLIFNIRWGMINAGEAVMEVSGIETINGHDSYHIITTAKSHPFFDGMYKVRNENESWIDLTSFCSLKYIQNQREGGYIKKQSLFFDYIEMKYTMIEHGNDLNDIKTVQGAIPMYTQDVLSSLYFLRTQPLEQGKEYYVNTQSGSINYPLRIVVYKKETVQVPAGKFECYVVEPFLMKNTGIFRSRGQVWIWFTADSRKIPVLMKSKFLIGSITAELISIQ